MSESEGQAQVAAPGQARAQPRSPGQRLLRGGLFLGAGWAVMFLALVFEDTALVRWVFKGSGGLLYLALPSGFMLAALVQFARVLWAGSAGQRVFAVLGSLPVLAYHFVLFQGPG